MTNKVDTAHDIQMTPEQKKQVDRLTLAEIKEIEENILENVTEQWTKVSRIILTTMIERDEGVTGLPEAFYLERVKALVEEGRLESAGDITEMKSSKVRLPGRE